MAKKTPVEIADKWRRRSEGAVSDYTKGIDSVSESPMTKAIAKKEKFKANLLKAIDDGKWEKGLDSVSLSEWKEITKIKGASNYPTGIRASESKVLEFQTELAPHIEAGKAILAKMPDITLADAKARAVAWIDHMSKFKRTKYK